jgi:Undecaprenyl-phosphate glucose phosphotransferase
VLREKRQIVEALFMGADLVVVTAAWFLAYWLRFSTDFVPIDKGVPPFATYTSMVVVIWVIWAATFRWMGLYKAMRGVRRIKEVILLFNANLLALLVFIAVTFLFREKTDPFSRLVLLYFGSLTVVLTIVQRLFLRYSLREARRRGYNLRFLLLVGTGRVANDIVERIRHHRELGVQLVGVMSKDGKEGIGPSGAPVLGAYTDISTILTRMDVDHIIIALSLEDHHLIPDIMAQIGDRIVDVRIVPDLYRFVTLGGTIEEFEGLPAISLQTTPLEGMNLVVKRIFDCLCSGILIVLLSPLFILLALLVKISSPGPILYRQKRISLDGTEFTILKFRTMVADSEASGPGWTTSNDTRVTAVGKFMRKWSIDEFPQLINVFLGHMSLVGPRPERPVYIQDFRQKFPRYMLRHKVPAGMTGWAQVNGWRGDTSIDKRLECDLYYIEHWSLGLDLKILFLTIFRGVRHKNAY